MSFKKKNCDQKFEERRYLEKWRKCKTHKISKK